MVAIIYQYNIIILIFDIYPNNYPLVPEELWIKNSLFHFDQLERDYLVVQR